MTSPSDAKRPSMTAGRNVCLSCWKVTTQETFDLNCHTCEHCGHHRQGARQQQAGVACPTRRCTPERGIPTRNGSPE